MGKINLSRLATDVREIADDLIDRFIADGTADLIEQYAVWVPILALNRLFGRDDRDGYMLVELSVAIWDSDESRSLAANEHIAAYFADLVAQRRREPGADIPSWMIHHPSELTDEEMVHGLIQMSLGNSDPTSHLIGNTMLALLSDRDLRSASARFGELVEEAINRVLWTDPPIPVLPARYARADTEIAGVPIRAGDAVIMGLSAAHTDPVLGGTEQLSSTTKVNRAYLSWGAGPHRCPSEDLARTIVTTGISQLLRRLPSLQLAVPPDQLRWRPSQFLRGLVELPVEFAPGQPRPRREEPAAPESPGQRAWLARLGSRLRGR
jgi:cytochrome P450